MTATPGHRACIRCHITKPVSQFGLLRDSDGSLSASDFCLACCTGEDGKVQSFPPLTGRFMSTGYILPDGRVTPATPDASIKKSSAARVMRGQMHQRFKALDILFPEFMDLVAEDPVLANTRLWQVTKWFPGIGKQRAEEMLTDLRLGPKRRIGGLTEAEAYRLARHRFVKSYNRRVRRLRRKKAQQG